jgi:AcrR family transcriptional regulator
MRIILNDLSTKEKILNAARQLFVEHGLNGTSMGKIAKLAGVNHSLIFHHFGNKANLWVAVKTHIFESKRIQSIPSTEQPFKDFVYELLVNSIKHYQENPDIVRMINWQRLERDEFKQPLSNSTIKDIWTKAFQHYQDQGDVHANHNIEFVTMLSATTVSNVALDSHVFIGPDDFDDYIRFASERLTVALSSA